MPVRPLTTGLLTLALVLAGCSDSGSSGTTQDPIDAPTSTQPPTTSSTTAATTTTQAGTTTTMPPLVSTLPPVAGWDRIPVDRAVFGSVTITSGADFDGVYVLGGCRRDFATAAGDAAPVPLWWSSDLATWQRGDGPSGVGCITQVESTAFGVFAVGMGRPLWSEDGRTWETLQLHEELDLELEGQLGNVQAIFNDPNGGRVTLLYSRAAENESTIATLVTTVDGTVWAAGPSGAAAHFDSSDIADVIAGGDGLLAVGASPGGEFVPTAAVFTSADGVVWRRVTPMSADFNDKIIGDVVATPHGFVAVGGDFFTTGLMTAWTSSDGIAWQRSPHPDESTDPSVAFMMAETATVQGDTVWAAGIDFDARRNDDGLLAFWMSGDGGLTWRRVDTPTGDIVPFEIMATPGKRIATWPPPRSRSTDPLQLFVADQ